MKRPAANDPAGGRKKQHTSIKEVQSVYDQTKQYLLATVKFPIDALTPEWRTGTNRPINEAHKRRLFQIFKETGVLRQDASHRLHVACTEAQVQQMLDHLRQKESQVESTLRASRDAEAEFPSFEDWESVVGEKAELMAGNHRVEAFKEYLQYSESPQVERWWVCNVYDRDALPQHLHIKLRANREDIILPDNHGQIWMELATLSLNNDKLFQGSNRIVEQEMLEYLGLSSRIKFPVRRLATLWKNDRWKSMITKWCQFSIGQATFMISTFEWMASCRIDDYWFTTFNQVIQVISTIHSRCGFDVQLLDWNQLAQLPAKHGREDVRDLFYPDLESNTEPQPSSRRQRDFLAAISDDAYYNLYQFLSSEPVCCFVDIQALLKTTKQEGKLMSTVISHVGQWMNREPTKVADRDNNKPLLRRDLVAGLHRKYGDEAEEKSIALQQQLLDYVRSHSKDFTSTAMAHYLLEYPDTHDDKYAARFDHTGWRTLLSLVLDFAGPNLQHPCMVRFNSEELSCKTSPIPASAVAQIARDLICQIPELAQNPALQSASAAEDLCKKMQLIVAQWVREQCEEALVRHGKEWQGSTFDLVEAERARSETLLKELSSSQSTLPDKHPDRAHEGEDADVHGSAERQSLVTTKQPRAPISTPTVRPSVTQSTAIGLHNLRTTRNAAHVHPARPNAAQPKDDKRSKVDKPHHVHVIRGVKQWRKRAVGAHSSI